MTLKKKKKTAEKKESALDRYVQPEIERLLTGRVLAIDPSSGSAGSQPGYSMFVAGRLVEAGTLEVGQGGDAHRRFFELRKTLLEDFEAPDVLVVENIAPMWGRGMPAGVLNLHRAIGVILSAFLVPVVWVSPVHWQKNVDRDTYPKSDTNDAIMLGYTAIKHAAEMQGREPPMSSTELRRWVYGKGKDV